MAPPPDDTTVVVCSYAGDDAELTLRCLRAVAAQAAPGRTLLVDMSPDERIAGQARRIAGVEVRRVPESTGLGWSRQHGLERAGTRHVAFLDSDAIPRPGWLAALRDAAEPADVAISGGPVLPVWPAGVRVPRLFRTASAGDFLSMLDLGPEPLDVPRVLPGNMLVDVEALGASGFGTELGRRAGDLFGAEEIAMMIAIVERGLRVVYTPGAAIDHTTTADRQSWAWMWRRLEAAGRESVQQRERLEPLPRRLTPGDRVFQALGAVPFLLGRRRGRRAAAGARP